MPLAERTAEATWKGNLLEGNGDVTFASGAISTLPVTWASRTQDLSGKTSPEELIAAAQAVCYAMSLSNVLAGEGHVPENLDVRATCTFDRVDGKAKITEMTIAVTGSVPDVDELQFQAAADKAEKTAPLPTLFAATSQSPWRLISSHETWRSPVLAFHTLCGPGSASGRAPRDTDLGARHGGDFAAPLSLITRVERQ